MNHWLRKVYCYTLMTTNRWHRFNNIFVARIKEYLFIEIDTYMLFSPQMAFKKTQYKWSSFALKQPLVRLADYFMHLVPCKRFLNSEHASFMSWFIILNYLWYCKTISLKGSHLGKNYYNMSFVISQCDHDGWMEIQA